MNATQTRARWTTINGTRTLAFNGETDEQAAARYARNDARQNDIDTPGYYTTEDDSMSEAQPEDDGDSETVWVPVGRGKWNEKRGQEIELTWGEVWTIHQLFSAYRNLRRGGFLPKAMQVLGELRDKGFGLEHHEYRDVTNWVDGEGRKAAKERGMRAVEEWRATQGR
jgi:hypothetical protein